MSAILKAVEDGALTAEIAGVISDRVDAAGLEIAERHGAPCYVVDAHRYPTQQTFETALLEVLKSRVDAEVVALAGFMRIVGAEIIARYAGRILNIHPSLLPAYKGLNTHQRVLDNRQSEHGCSVHFVNRELDAGAVVMQARVAVRENDTAATLAERVLHYEHLIYPQCLALLCAGRLCLQNERCLLDGRPLLKPLQPYAERTASA